MSNQKLMCPLLVFIVLGAFAAAAQGQCGDAELDIATAHVMPAETPPASPPAPVSLKIRRTVREVQKVFAASDRRGRPATALLARQTAQLANGIPAPLTTFASADRTLRTAL